MNDSRAVRAGEELDLGALNAWIGAHAPEVGAVTGVEQFPGGFSNLTYLLKAAHGEFVLRRPPAGAVPGKAHDMVREHRILRVLAERAIPAPWPVAVCEDAAVLGAPFYLMQRVHGTILRGTNGIPPAAAELRALSESFVETLIAIHSVRASDPTVAALGKPDGYVARQVAGWTRRWEASRTSEVPAMGRAAEWIAAHRPSESGACLVHNDYKHDNLVLDPAVPSRIVAVLDWEMATFGDPLMDVGTSLGYWVEAGDPPVFRALGLGVTALAGNFTRAELWERYLERTQRPPTDPLFYYVFGVFKIGVIAQQILARYLKGLTRDERFARLDVAIDVLAATAERAITRGSMSATA